MLELSKGGARLQPGSSLANAGHGQKPNLRLMIHQLVVGNLGRSVPVKVADTALPGLRK